MRVLGRLAAAITALAALALMAGPASAAPAHPSAVASHALPAAPATCSEAWDFITNVGTDPGWTAGVWETNSCGYRMQVQAYCEIIYGGSFQHVYSGIVSANELETQATC